MRSLLVIGAVVFAVVFGALLAAKESGALHPPLSREKAEAAALANPELRSFLRAQGWTDVKSLPLDEQHWRVTFFDRGHSVLDASVGPGGRIDAVQPHAPGIHATGSSIVWSKPMLIGLSVLFLLATAVAPLRRLRNLDAGVLAGGILAVLLFYDDRLVAADAYAGAMLLGYLGLRCAWVGLRAPPVTGDAPSLWSVLLARTPVAVRTRIVTMVAAALVAASALITVTSTGISDVAFAGLAGATTIERGELPYGNLTSEVVHGDTYPIVTYVLYLPTALISPVDDSFDSLEGALWLNALALIGAALLAYAIGSRTAVGRGRTRALAMAVAWLSCPAVLLAASGGGNDVPTGFLVMAALALAARPALAAGTLALATAAKLGPVAALLLWLAGRRRPDLVPAIAATALVLTGCLALLLALGGGASIREMVDALAFQFRRGSFHSVWTQLGSRSGQAAFQALVITFILVVAVRLARQERPQFRSFCALAAAALLGLQLAANYWTFAYLAWALPFILVALFPQEPQRSPQSAPRAP